MISGGGGAGVGQGCGFDHFTTINFFQTFNFNLKLFFFRHFRFTSALIEIMQQQQRRLRRRHWRLRWRHWRQFVVFLSCFFDRTEFIKVPLVWTAEVNRSKWTYLPNMIKNSRLSRQPFLPSSFKSLQWSILFKFMMEAANHHMDPGQWGLKGWVNAFCPRGVVAKWFKALL